MALRTTTSTISHCRLEAEPGLQCGDPYPCEFWDRCTAYKPADWVFYLPRRPAAQAEALDRRGDNKVASLHEHVPEEADTATVKNPSFFTVRTRTAWSGCDTSPRHLAKIKSRAGAHAASRCALEGCLFAWQGE